ncbi:trehalose synthase [Chthoniobacter flavus Ellin428]|uniref:Maltokinase n=1 Tax=Chthoniobacter flavus Ellin428 TaxID=497964 RepID=B4CZ69_9BACT|nr:maltose alpha-D-glucosyltransferase [Chthoniobacter flavus]EDY20760.1 trehalose synthase [Chthoniobacter flavus Ellin428]TCO89654.1 maltokinase [Chthoniobacter flavus]
MSDPLWFKSAVIYELHVKTFMDSDGDGLGDFRGLIERLDYFTELGVTALWLLPFYPSPLKDDGYDIADYFAVHPSYGTLDDFRTFLDLAHERGLRVITELVLNHTSDQNAWFQRARRAPKGSPERDFYVWTDDPRKYKEARIIFKDFEPSNWTWDPVAKAYFWHRFYAHQPDLNFDNPLVHAELFRAIDFWMAMGVDGLRLDAIPYLYEREGTNCENLDETHDFIRKLRAHIDTKFPNRMLLAEANQWPEDAVEYFGNGDECHMEFHFPLMPRMFMAIQMEDRFPILDILDQTPTIPENCQWAIFLRNHDELTLEMVTDEERDYMYRVYAEDTRARINLGIRRRLAPLLGNNRRKIELINSLLFSLPGTPIIYYGDEIGMGDNFYLGDRNGVRTPMQWSPDRNAGFSKANPQQLYLPTIIDPEYHYESINVENQQRNLSSLFWWMRRMLGVREKIKAFSHGTIEFLQPDNAKVLVYVRRFENEAVLVIANLSRFSQVVELDLAAYAGMVPEELFGHANFPEIKQTPWVLTLGPHGFYWLALRPPPVVAAVEAVWAPPELKVPATWGNGLIKHLEREVLPAYIPTRRWYGGKERVLREMKIVQKVPFGGEGAAAQLFVVEVSFTDGLPESYLLPVAFADENTTTRLAAEAPQAIIARLDGQQSLCDALHLPEARAELLRLIAGQTAASGRTRLVGTKLAAFDPAAFERSLANSRLVSVDQSNTSIAFGDTWLLKILRKFERGAHPDTEITRFLNEDVRLPCVPPYLGSLSLADRAGDASIGMLFGFVVNQGDGWTYTLDALARYFDRVLEARRDFDSTAAPDLIGAIYRERARQLGQRTAEMHRALASVEERADFAPEPFSTLYQRSLYQGMRGSAGYILRRLKRQLPRLPEDARADAASLLASHAPLLTIYARLLTHRIDASRIRIHGDFHLAQVLNTGKDFVIIDFEGEPRLPLSERRLKRSALRDVAGMLRSFDYAVTTTLRNERADDVQRLAPWAQAWAETIRDSYLTAYLEAAAGASFLPTSAEDTQLLLEAYQLDKALYEVAYDLSYRPGWVATPLRAVKTMLAQFNGH